MTKKQSYSSQEVSKYLTKAPRAVTAYIYDLEQQIQNLSQRGINLDGIKIIYEMRDRISDLQIEIESLKENIKVEKNLRSKSEKEIHKSYKNEIVRKSNKDLRKN